MCINSSFSIPIFDHNVGLYIFCQLSIQSSWQSVLVDSSFILLSQGQTNKHNPSKEKRRPEADVLQSTWSNHRFRIPSKPFCLSAHSRETRPPQSLNTANTVLKWSNHLLLKVPWCHQWIETNSLSFCWLFAVFRSEVFIKSHKT